MGFTVFVGLSVTLGFSGGRYKSGELSLKISTVAIKEVFLESLGIMRLNCGVWKENKTKITKSHP